MPKPAAADEAEVAVPVAAGVGEEAAFLVPEVAVPRDKPPDHRLQGNPHRDLPRPVRLRAQVIPAPLVEVRHPDPPRDRRPDPPRVLHNDPRLVPRAPVPAGCPQVLRAHPPGIFRPEGIGRRSAAAHRNFPPERVPAEEPQSVPAAELGIAPAVEWGIARAAESGIVPVAELRTVPAEAKSAIFWESLAVPQLVVLLAVR